jgi:propionate CoA-transferase
MKIISAQEAAALVQDNWCLIPGGFGSCGHPDALTKALRVRFLETGSPKNLTLLFGAGPGDKKGNGIDAIALEGLVGRAIGGFWGLCPELVKLALDGKIEAHNWPQGVISQLFSSIACGSPGIISRIGLDTFVDPVYDGGVIDSRKSKPLVEHFEFRGKEKLFYPSIPVDVALLRGTMSDERGNISFCEETSYMDSLAQALATKNSGGVVIVQVKKVVPNGSIEPSRVNIPGFLVNYVVLAEEADHPQTYGKAYDPSYTSATADRIRKPAEHFPLEKRIIAHRAALELAKHPHANVNLGIGIPALIGAAADELGLHDSYTITVESGLVGGIPDEGLSFGATMNPQAVVEQSVLFDFYDGGGIDVAFLGFAEVDYHGNVNVSKFGRRVSGSGGFINITQDAKKVVFCGVFAADGLVIRNVNGKLQILEEGKISKFCKEVQHLTFNGPAASRNGVEVMYITERAVFHLDDGHLTLIEIAPGITIDDLRSKMDCPFNVSEKLIEMPDFDKVF